MSRVEIEAGGRRIIVDADTDLHHVALEAQRLWDHTEGATTRNGPAVGFTAAPPRWTPDIPTTASGRRYSPGPFSPITAEQTDQAR